VGNILLIDEAKRASLDVQVLTRTPVESLIVRSRQVITPAGPVGYGDLVIATGTRARTIQMFADRENVFYLRNIDDACRLRKALTKAKSAVVVGFGFIGCEFASSALALGVDVTIIDSSLKPYSHFGRYFSDALTSLHRGEGAKLMLGSTVAQVNGGSRVEELVLDTGETVSGDIIVVAVGATPNTEWLANSGLTVDDGVLCDANLQAAPHVFAVGDVTRWPHPVSGRLTRVEHWTNAVDQAATVAHNITHPGSRRMHAATPYFWSSQFGKSIQYLGFLDAFSCEAWLRSDRGGIAAVLGKDDRIRGVIGIDAATVLVRCRSLVAEGVSWDLGIKRVGEIAEKAGFQWF
jgi:NADPH-dependent 2,4-dienoyl-CoA reductase/sulfur reductase-like enzyme